MAATTPADAPARSLTQLSPKPTLLVAEATTTWTVRTEVFDGPLDLLLYLVKRDGVDLRKVSIAPVCDSYLSFLGRMQELNISVASDYLVMAATLCHLKSLELLPRMPSVLDEEDGPDPKEALARQLEAYEQFKQAAEQLEARPWVGRDVFVREPMDVGEIDRPLVPGVDAFALLDAYYAVLTRPDTTPKAPTIKKPEVDLGACARSVLRTLGRPGVTMSLHDLLVVLPTRGERVVAFLAVLEMIRLQWLGLEVLPGHLAGVNITSRVPHDQPLDQLNGEVEEALA